MILKQLTKEQNKSYSSLISSYRGVRQKIVDDAVLFAGYSSVYGILAESDLYKERKTYLVSVHETKFSFEAPPWFNKEKKELLGKYGRLSDELHSLYMHIVWNGDTEYWNEGNGRSKRDMQVYVVNPPELGDLIRDICNGETSIELTNRIDKNLGSFFSMMGTLEKISLGGLVKKLDEWEKTTEKEPSKKNKPDLPREWEDLKNSFSARNIMPLADLSASERKLAKEGICETGGCLEIIGSLGDVHRA